MSATAAGMKQANMKPMSAAPELHSLGGQFI
jgi:hypothetical protein